jgi:cell division protein FtsQ
VIESATVTHDYGVLVTMRGGIQLRFGTGGNRAGQWAAAAAVLADPALTSLTYVDLRVPQRPAAGGTSDPTPATTPVTTTTTPTTAVTGTP